MSPVSYGLNVFTKSWVAVHCHCVSSCKKRFAFNYGSVSLRKFPLCCPAIQPGLCISRETSWTPPQQRNASLEHLIRVRLDEFSLLYIVYTTMLSHMVISYWKSLILCLCEVCYCSEHHWTDGNIGRYLDTAWIRAGENTAPVRRAPRHVWNTQSKLVTSGTRGSGPECRPCFVRGSGDAVGGPHLARGDMSRAEEQEVPSVSDFLPWGNCLLSWSSPGRLRRRLENVQATVRTYKELVITSLHTSPPGAVLSHLRDGKIRWRTGIHENWNCCLLILNLLSVVSSWF